MSSIQVASCGALGDDAWDDTELIRAYDKSVKQWKKNRNEDYTECITAGPGPWVTVKEDTTQHKSQNNGETTSMASMGVKLTSSQQSTNHESKLGNIQQQHKHGSIINTQALNSRMNEKSQPFPLPTDLPDTNTDLNDFMPRFPVPPLPASLTRPDGSFNYEKGEIPALLMSWYMAGYQAGYFDAKRDLAKQESLDYNDDTTDN